MKNKIVALLAVLGIAYTGVAFAQQLYPRLRAAYVEFYRQSTGVKAWQMGVDRSGNLTVTENVSLGADVLKVNAASGGLQLRSRTKTQIGALAPVAAGEIIFNSTGNTLCVSTGSTAGAWIQLQFTDSTKLACHDR